MPENHGAPPRRNLAPLIALVAAAAIFLPILIYAQTTSDNSTSGLSGSVIDEEWQKASAQYDQQREAILSAVKKDALSGPFQPDWQSLSRYEVPEWYKDAKFGIFIHW